MALKYWAYIFLSPGFSLEQNTMEMDSGMCRFKAIGIDKNNKELVIEIAKQLVLEGVQMIELCGGFGPIWIAKITEAINGVIPIGSVAYGPEARQPLLDILNKP
jgi:hypothetical protein